MSLKKQIPNLLTLGNLFCGTLAAIFAVKGQFDTAALFVVIGIVFDFFDGFAARLLKVTGELGKQLDSLADVVTSGVVPGIVMYSLLTTKVTSGNFVSFVKGKIQGESILESNDYFPYLGLLLTLAACYRLAKFNLDTRQTDSFIGLPTPAMALFVVSLPLILIHSDNSFFVSLVQNNVFLIVVTFGLSYLMNAEIPLFALKFKNFNFQENKIKFVFLIVSILLILLLQYVAVPLIIIMYVSISMYGNWKKIKI